MRQAPTAADAESYLDVGDLFIRLRIEVKQISRNFTSAQDWPFRECFVSNKAAVDRAGDAVLVYVTVSQDKRYRALIKRSTRPHWYVVETVASNTGNKEQFYACPLNLVQFGPL